MATLEIYDTTLRDGAQREGISFSASDKIKITKKLDELGISYVEGGWPGSNPKDIEYFERIKKIPLKNTKVTAFGSTRRPDVDVTFDPNVQSLLAAGTEAITIFGKSWDFQVTNILGTTLNENLNMIWDTVSYLKGKNIEVIYDAEHFFDGYKQNPDYALATLESAQRAGADKIVLCDTNGGIMPLELMDIISEVKKRIQVPLGIHAHNDSGLAAAISIIAAQMGLLHIQGTINGYGERCGNANLCTIIPNLKLKLNMDCIGEEELKNLTKVSRYVSELANLSHQESQPFVGSNAFAHKAGVHVSAVSKSSKAYEHIDPAKVGNKRQILISELSGKSSVLHKAKENNIELLKDYQTKEVLDLIKNLESQGYQFEGAEGSFELLIWKALNSYRNLFELEGFRVIVEKHKDSPLVSEATIKVNVDNHMVHTASEGNGPVNALDNALRKALEEVYPQINNIKLEDYKVRVLDGQDGTGAKVRVLIESSGDEKKKWGTVGVSSNIIEASWLALVDSIEYGLLCKEINAQKALIKNNS